MSMTNEDPGAVLNALARALVPHLLEALRERQTADDWVDVIAMLPTCKRVLSRACRRGELPARRLKRRWLVRRSAFDSWVEAHETGTKPSFRTADTSTALPPATPHSEPTKRSSSALSPARQHEQDMEALRAKLDLRKLTDAERAAKGMPPYEVDRAYAEFLSDDARRKEEEAAKERDERDPLIAKKRAEATRIADAAAALRPSKLPRVKCKRCKRTVSQRKDGQPVAHACPHRFGYGCMADGEELNGIVPHCPWCKAGI